MGDTVIDMRHERERNNEKERETERDLAHSLFHLSNIYSSKGWDQLKLETGDPSHVCMEIQVLEPSPAASDSPQVEEALQAFQHVMQKSQDVS